jgi:hypothetical protein
VALNCICYQQFKILVYNGLLSGLILLHILDSMTVDPSPTADATRLMLPPRTSPLQRLPANWFRASKAGEQGASVHFIVISKRMKGKDNLSTDCSAKSLKLAFDMIVPRTLLKELIREQLQRKT